MSIVYAVDPLQFFRRAAYAPVFSTNERYQIPGLARNYDYDTVIAGTSMAQNFYLGYADKVLGARTLKIAISGSSAHEQFLALNVAIRTGKVKRVIWGVDQWVFRGTPGRVRDDLGVFPYYLYETNPLGYLWYLFNASNLSRSIEVLTDRSRLLGASTKRIPDDWNTFDKYYHFNRVNAVKDYFKDYFNPVNFEGLGDSSMLEATDLGVMSRSLEDNAIALIKGHPEIQFDIYFPPYSILNAKFYQMNSPIMYERLLAFQSLVIKQLIASKNVRVFDFSDDASITHNLDLYKDMGHFDASINELIVRSIATGDHLIDPADPEASIWRLRAQVAAYPEPPAEAGTAQKSAGH
jgi:hypothetical protein